MARVSIFIEFSENPQHPPYGNVRVDPTLPQMSVTGHIYPTDWLLVADIVALVKEYRDKYPTLNADGK